MQDSLRRRASMGGQTKYSRNTRTKEALRTSMQNTPRYGNKACNLCERGRYPDDLSFKVSKYKTCGDVHLELSLIDPSKATCEAGQDAYRDLCCPQSKFELPSIKFPAISVATGLFLFWIFTRKLRKVQSASGGEDSSDEEEGKKYQRMKDDQSNGSKRRKRSKSRERSMQRTRSKESKFSSKVSKSSTKNSGATTVKGSGGRKDDVLPDMMNMTFKMKNNKKANKLSAYNASNALQQQQRLLQQQYYGTKKQQKGASDEYYNIDDDTAYGDSTLGGHDTVAGESINAVITQVV